MNKTSVKVLSILLMDFLWIFLLVLVLLLAKFVTPDWYAAITALLLLKGIQGGLIATMLHDNNEKKSQY